MDEGTLNSIPEEPAPPERPDTAPAALWQGFLRNIGSALRLAAFRRTGAAEFAALPRDLVLLALADPALNLLFSWLISGRNGTFAAASFAAFFLHIPLFLLCGLTTARLLASTGLVTTVPAAFIALSLLLESLHGVLEWAEQLGWLTLPDWLAYAPHYYRFFLWWSAAAALFLARICPAGVRRRIAILAFFLVLVFLPLWLFPRGDLWTATLGEGEAVHLTEEVLDSQPRLMQESLDRLLPGGRSVTHLYFVGFAGDGGQGVFMRELLSVERLFGERFGASGRSVAMVNNPATTLDRPFATASNLRRTLAQVGRVMNRDKDVLFLYLTSHGSSDGELAVANGALELEQITPDTLREMLGEAGIKWRVIAVSACFPAPSSTR